MDKMTLPVAAGFVSDSDSRTELMSNKIRKTAQLDVQCYTINNLRSDAQVKQSFTRILRKSEITAFSPLFTAFL